MTSPVYNLGWDLSITQCNITSPWEVLLQVSPVTVLNCQVSFLVHLQNILKAQGISKPPFFSKIYLCDPTLALLLGKRDAPILPCPFLSSPLPTIAG
jgi:hypothetical protein